MRIKASALIGVFAFLVMVGASTPSEAAFISYVCNDANCTGGDDLIVSDGGGGDANPASGAITVIAVPFAGWEVLVETSLSKPAVGSPAEPQLDINYSLTNTTGGASALWLYASDTGFTGIVSLLLELGGTATINPFSLSARVWGGSSNSNLDLTTLLASLGPVVSSPYAVSSTGGPVGGSVNPYSLTLGLAVAAATSGGSITGDLSLSSIPEPVSALLLGFGLLCGGAVVRRRRGLA